MASQPAKRGASDAVSFKKEPPAKKLREEALATNYVRTYKCVVYVEYRMEEK